VTSTPGSADPHPPSGELAFLDAHALASELAERGSAPVVEQLVGRMGALDHAGPELHALIALSPTAVDEAARLDEERRAGRIRGPLHGIPVLVKDNIDTAGSMGTTAGSLALTAAPPTRDAPLVERLRAAGAIVAGKANLSEWANIRSKHSSSGWSAVGGQCRNPHALDRSPGGSSSGSGASVAAGYVPLAVGTETDGSIICPASVNGVVGLKPTVGSIPGTGIVPISHRQDTAGPMGRSVRDVAALFAVLSDTELVDVARRPVDQVRGLRIGIPRKLLWGYDRAADDGAATAVTALRDAGVDVVDEVELPELPEGERYAVALGTELVHDVAAYLATRTGLPVIDLAEVVAFNLEHAATEMRWFGQDWFDNALEIVGRAHGTGFDDPAYVEAVAETVRVGRTGIDDALRTHRLDALVAPTYPPTWKIDLVNGDHVTGASSTHPAMAGYPVISVPCGMYEGLPLGVAFMAAGGSEPTLLRLGAGVEALLGQAPPPAFRPPTVG